LEDLGAVGDKKKADLRNFEHVGVEWIHLVRPRDKWQAIAKAVCIKWACLEYLRNYQLVNNGYELWS
jgi:hypothetical protein